MSKDRFWRGKRYWAILALMAAILGISGGARSLAEMQDVVDTKESQEAFLYLGDIISLRVYSLTRISISEPGIVDILNADINEVVLIGKKEGETQVFIWDEYGKRAVVARVFGQDLDMMAARMASLLASAKINGVTLEKNNFERRIVMTGRLLKEMKKKVEDLLKEFGTKNSVFINLIQEEGDLLQIDVQVSELSTTLTKALGFDWTAGDSASLQLKYEETLPSFDGSAGDLFKIGDFARTTAIMATVNALITEGKGRVLSKPSIVVTNGEEADFQVGGEIPIRTTTSSTDGNSVQENISYKEYGVGLTVTPEIINGKIAIELSVDIRDIDASNAVGSDVAFTTRTASTKLLLNDGQTIVLAGLIKHNQSETINKVPFLGDIPIVGLLFRSKSSPDSETEVVISLTPRILYQKKLEKIYAQQTEEPGEETLPEDEMSADEAELLEGLDDMELEEGEDAGMESEYLDEEEESAETAESAEAKEGAGLSAQGKTPVAAGVMESAQTTVKDGALSENRAASERQSAAGVRRLDTTSPDDASKDSGKPGEAGPDNAPAAAEKPVAPGDGPVPLLSKTDEAIVEGMAGQDPKTSTAITDYVQAIQRRISQGISYPYEAKEKGWEGTVVLTLNILSDGSLNEVTVKEASGQKIFDKDAVNTAQILAPFDPFPAEIDLEELYVTIPIVYSQESGLLQGLTDGL